MDRPGVPTRRRLLTVTAGVAAALCVPQVARASVPVIRYAMGGGLGPNGIETLFFTEFMQKNVLRRYGKDYTLDVTYTRGTPEAASLMAAERVDLATQACASLATVIVRDAVPGGMKVIADIHDVKPGYSQIPFFVLAGSPIERVADLRGKTIAVNAFGTLVDLIARTVLRKNGLDPRKDVRLVEISFPSIGPALRENRVQGGFLPVPYGVTESSKGGVRELFNATDAFPASFANLFQAARVNFLKTSGDAVRAWLDDYVTGLHWLYEPSNRVAAVALAAEVSQSAPALLDSFFLTDKDYFRNLNACLTANMLQGPVDAMREQGLLTSAVDIAPYVDMSYLPRPC